MHNKKPGTPLLFFLIAVFVLNAQSAWTQVRIVSVTNHKEKHKYSSRTNFTHFQIEYDGDITVTDDDRGIKSISDDGYLEISKTTFGNRRRIILEGTGGGDFSKRYYEGRNEVPFNPEGRQWLASILLEVVRSTGIDAAGRVDRIFKKDGIDGILEEISEISSNSGQARYFQRLLEKDLSSENIAEVGLSIGDMMSSESERGRLYRNNRDVFLKDDIASRGFFRGINELSSNSERGSILKRVLEEDLTERQLKGVLLVLLDMSSDSERGSILRRLNSKDFRNSNVITDYFDVIEDMSSDSERSKVLRDLLDKQKLNTSAQRALFRSVEDMSSSSSMGSVMRTAIVQLQDSEQVLDPFFEALSAVSSDTETGSIMRELIEEEVLSEHGSIMLFEAVNNLSSNTEMGHVLRLGSTLITSNERVIDAYFEAVTHLSSNTEMGSVLREVSELDNVSEKILIMTADASTNLSSDTERGRVLRNIIEECELTNNIVLAVIEASTSISSNTEKGRVLSSLGRDGVISAGELYNAYKSAANSLTSDTEFRRVMEAVDYR